MERDETFFVSAQTISNVRRQRLLNVTLEFTYPRMPGDKERGRGKSLEHCSQKQTDIWLFLSLYYLFILLYFNIIFKYVCAYMYILLITILSYPLRSLSIPYILEGR